MKLHHYPVDTEGEAGITESQKNIRKKNQNTRKIVKRLAEEIERGIKIPLASCQNEFGRSVVGNEWTVFLNSNE